jgi:hypothetical protein
MFKKTTSTVIILLMALSVSFAQKKTKTVVQKKTPVATQPPTCQLTLKDAPELRGLRLDMSIEEAKKAIAFNIWKEIEFDRKYDELGVKNFFIYAPKDVPNLEGIESVFMHFYNEKLFNFSFSYSEKFPGTIDEFTDNLSGKINLPKLWADTDPFKNLTSSETMSVNGQSVTVSRNEPTIWDVRTLTCSEFNVNVTRYRSSQSLGLSMRNLLVSKELERLSKERIEKKQKEFKP